MAVIRRRFLFWLIKAYVKRWGKVISISFIVGLAIFFLLLKFYPVLLRLIPLEKKVIVGMTGTYTRETIPVEIMSKVSRGLTTVKEDGTVHPDLASSWEIQEEGKKYVFHLRNDAFFSDGTPFTASSIDYDFADVTVQRPDEHTVSFTLKDVYAPFLVTVSQPVLRKGYIGIGEYTINNIELNGDFIKSIQLLSRRNRFKSELYLFYPSDEALKIALALGEVTNTTGMTDLTLKNTSLDTFSNIQKKQFVNYRNLVTLFYNTTDPVLSDKKLRSGLSYAIPDEFAYGERTVHPYPPKSMYFNIEHEGRLQDFNHAKLLISSSLESASGSAVPTLQLKVLPKYRKAADEIVKAWKQVDIKVKIEEVEGIPENFQLYLGDFNVPRDPDQYTLWHSGQQNNITQFKNLRIDKLLEDGRKTVDPQERLKIYYDFQKYLIDESPASFLYFPYEYQLVRR